MIYSARLTSQYAGQSCYTFFIPTYTVHRRQIWFAGVTSITYFLAFIRSYHGNRTITQRIVFILPNSYHSTGTSLNAFFASITIISINGDEIIARAIFIAVVC